MTKTYGPAEVAHAAAVPIATFRSWLARDLIGVPAPATGSARQFTLAEAIRAVAMGKLVAQGLPVGAAAAFCARVDGDYSAEKTIMIVGMSPKGARTVDIVAADQITKALDLMPCFTVLDLSAVAARTAQVLNDPLTKHRAELRIESAFVGASGEKITIEVHDPSAQAPPARPRVRKRRLEPA
jgi:hypothetical protein